MEDSYLKNEAETFTQGTSGIYLRPVKVSAHEPSPISRNNESPKITSFGLLGFSSLKPYFSVAVAVAVALFLLHKDFFQGSSDTMLDF